MSWQDIANSLLELSFVCAMLGSVRKIRRDKSLEGIALAHVSVIFISACWYVYYFAHLDQWFSCASSVAYFLVTSTWVGHVAAYTLRELRCGHQV